MTRLSVNLNKVALLRNSRTLGIPSVMRAAIIALDAGAHGITVHPRPDERHIRAGDVRDLAALLRRTPGRNSISKAIRFTDCWKLRAPRVRINARWCRTNPARLPRITAGTSGATASDSSR